MGSGGSDIGPVLEAMDHADLMEFSKALDQRVRGGKATLEDFGKLARIHKELSRRSCGCAATSDMPTSAK